MQRDFSQIMIDLVNELSRQEEKGMTETDRERTLLDWHEMIADYNAWSRRMAAMGSLDKARRRYIQVAALALSAVYQLDVAVEMNNVQG